MGPVTAGDDDPAEGSLSPFSSRASSPCFYQDMPLTSTPIRQLIPPESFEHSAYDSAPSCQNSDTITSNPNSSTSGIDLNMYSDISECSFNMHAENPPVSSSFSECDYQCALADVTPQEHEVAEEKEVEFEDILTSPPVETYKLVFDNIDKTVKPRYMRMNAQNKSLHYVQLYAVKDRVNLSQLSQTFPSICEVALDTILPSDEDNASLMENMSILIARVIVNRIPFFNNDFKKLVPNHIQHKYSKEMCNKSEVVSVQ